MSMRYYLEGSNIYLFTTEGMKTHDIDANPEICLQVEELHDPIHWRSVIVNGQAKRLCHKYFLVTTEVSHSRSVKR